MNACIFVAFIILFVLPACAAVTVTPTTEAYPAERWLYYELATRIIGLPDGSQLVIYRPQRLNDRPSGLDVFITAPSADRERDRSFRLEMFIPNEIAAGYPAQIRSVTMSPDRKSLALIGGWFSTRDQRGHNGVFLLRLDSKGGDVWMLDRWFDVKELALGDVAFGPGNLLMVTSRPHQPADSTPPMITLFTRDGQKVGSFIKAAEGITASRILESRLARIGDDAYGLYDPHGARVRFLRIRNNAVTEERQVPIPFSTDGINVVGFDPRPDGRVVFARTVIVDGRGKTFVTLLDSTGRVTDEWQPARSWRYGYVDDRHILRGFETVPGQDRMMKITAVTLR